MQKITTLLITGGTGFIGQKVVRRLLSKGFKVRVLVRDSNKAIDKQAEVAIGDMTDKSSLERATKDVQGVVHLAAVKSDEKSSFNINVVGAQNLVDASLQNNVDFIINISSSSTKIQKRGLYAKTKNMADEIFHSSGIPTTTLKPSIVYSDLENAVFGALAKFSKLPVTPVIGDGKCNFYPIHTDDLAEMISIAVTNNETKGKTYDIGGPDTLFINEIIIQISKKVFKKKRVHIFHIPKFIGVILAKFFGLVMENPPITMSNILGSTQNVIWNKERAFKDFNFTPRSFLEGLKDVEQQFKNTEAEIIYKYMYSSSGKNFKLSTIMVSRYYEALKSNGLDRINSIFLRLSFLIGPADAITKIFYSNSNLQRRLLVATALVECDTQSASWLLPKNRGLIGLFLDVFILIIRSLVKIIIGVFLLLIGFPQKYAK